MVNQLKKDVQLTQDFIAILKTYTRRAQTFYVLLSAHVLEVLGSLIRTEQIHFLNVQGAAKCTPQRCKRSTVNG